MAMCPIHIQIIKYSALAKSDKDQTTVIYLFYRTSQHGKEQSQISASFTPSPVCSSWFSEW